MFTIIINKIISIGSNYPKNVSFILNKKTLRAGASSSGMYSRLLLMLEPALFKPMYQTGHPQSYGRP